ncbi:hypothetical protein KM043_015715 [Ampulex compressa]|nr:hypothetical protein KM043_015715 [Ampulex compressa]
MDVTKLTKRKQRAKKAANLQQLAEDIKELGDAYFEAGQLENALQEYLEQLEVCEKLQDKLNVAVAHRMIGEVYANLGDYEQALLHQNLHLEGAKDINNTLEEQRAFATLGRTYFCLAESLDEHTKERKEALANAKDSYIQSIHLCNSLKKTNIELKEMMMMRARLLLNLGLILEVQKEPEQAISLIEQAATLCTTHNLQEDLHRTQIALGGIYERQCNIVQALKHFDSAANTNDLSLNAEAKLLKAELLLKSGEWFESRKVLVSLYVTTGLPQNVTLQTEKFLRISVTLCQAEDKLCLENNVQAKLKLYETLGDAAVAANCFEKAIYYYRQMLYFAEESGSKFTGAALISLAQTLKDAGQYNEALEFAERELQLCTDAHEICRSALFLADLSVIAKCPDAKIRESYNLALENAKKCEDTRLEISVLKELWYYLENSGQFENAAQTRQKLDAVSKSHSVTESESELEDFKIGTDICLDDLSDVEEEMKAKGTVRTIRKRTKKGPILKRNEKGETELHVACINGNVDYVQKLLEGGHPINITDHFGWTPLHEAANHGFLEVTKLLLDSGADVNNPGGPMCQGVTPLHDAASCGNLSIMRLLMEYGANPVLKTNDNDTVLDCLEEWKNRADALTTDEQTEYDLMYKELSRVIPKCTNRKKKTDKNAENVWPKLVDNKVDAVKNDFEKTSAGEDYKRTIARLKHRTDLSKAFANHSHMQCTTTPLLNSEQVFTDDWLEDDIGTNTKRKSGDFLTISKRKHTANLTCDKIVKRQKTNIMPKNDKPMLTTSEESNDSNISENFSIFNEYKKDQKKHQVSLLSVGFTRESESRTPSPDPMSDINLDSQLRICPKSMNFQVLVDEKRFDMELDVLSKGEELIQNILLDTQNRFYDATGCTVKLNLKTVNGMVVSAENIQKNLKDAEDINCVKCEISNIKIPSIIERYNIICRTHKREPQAFMTKCLKTCENTSIFRLRQNQSNAYEHIAILYTLEYEINLQVLCLSGTVSTKL